MGEEYMTSNVRKWFKICWLFVVVVWEHGAKEEDLRTYS
jgi:hypothetical protein